MELSIRLLHPRSFAHLNDLPSQGVIRPENWPTAPVGLGKLELELRTHDLKRAFIRVNGPIKRNVLLVSLLV